MGLGGKTKKRFERGPGRCSVAFVKGEKKKKHTGKGRVATTRELYVPHRSRKEPWQKAKKLKAEAALGRSREKK